MSMPHDRRAVSRRDGTPIQAPAQLAEERLIPSPPPAGVAWVNIGLAAGFAFGAALAFVAGDRKGHYNGWLVGLGWALVLLAWRTYANRKRGFVNPFRNLAQGAGLAALAGLGLIVQLVGILIALFAILGVLALAERVLHLA